LNSFLQKFETDKRGNFCTITIDDCLEEDVNKVIPICIKHNIPLTLFLPVRFSLNHEALPGTYLQKLLQKVNKLIVDGIKIEYTNAGKNIFLQKVHHIFKIETMKTLDFESKIWKVLKENKIEASDLISDGNKVIQVDKVKKISTNPLFTFQSHTYNHETLGLCNNDEIDYEFSVSRNTLQEITQKEVYAICYPYGSKEIVGDRIFEIVNKYYK
jgi:peptidoglycan/xylan/chitin deacetylase (PgdA/CDA1 family)